MATNCIQLSKPFAFLSAPCFFTSDANRAKAAGININLWLGLGMLALGVLFLFWFRMRPLRHEVPNEDSPAQPSGEQ